MWLQKYFEAERKDGEEVYLKVVDQSHAAQLKLHLLTKPPSPPGSPPASTPVPLHAHSHAINPFLSTMILDTGLNRVLVIVDHRRILKATSHITIKHGVLGENLLIGSSSL